MTFSFPLEAFTELNSNLSKCQNESFNQIVTTLSPLARQTLKTACEQQSRDSASKVMTWLERAHQRPWFRKLDQHFLSKIDDERIYFPPKAIEGLIQLIDASPYVLRGTFAMLSKIAKKILHLDEVERLMGRVAHYQSLEKDQSIRVSFDLWSADFEQKSILLDQVIKKVATISWGELMIDRDLSRILTQSTVEIEKITKSRLYELVIDSKIHAFIQTFPKSNLESITSFRALAKNFLSYHFEEELCKEYLGACEKLVAELGFEVVKKLIDLPAPTCQKERFANLKIVQILGERADEIDIDELDLSLKQSLLHRETFSQLLQKFDQLAANSPRNCLNAHSVEDKELSLERLEEPGDQGKQNALDRDYAKICAQEKHYREMSFIERKRAARALGQCKTTEGRHSFESTLSLLAIARITTHQVTGKYPYRSQMLAVIKILKDHTPDLRGAIAQVRTGEGKSICVGLLALCLALQNHSIDIITSSRYLAKRDQRDMASLFDYFDISSSQICEDHPPKSLFDGQILFGTNTDFEFAHLRQLLDKSPAKLWTNSAGIHRRSACVAIVDEADNLFIDLALNSARIALNRPDVFKRVYLPIYSLVKDQKGMVFAAINGDETKWPALLTTLFKQLNERCARLDELHQLAEDLTQKLKIWIESAYIAQFCKRLNVDYVVAKAEGGSVDRYGSDQIVIVDRECSGRLVRASRWERGIHEFLELKHGLKIQHESFMPASISHSTYFGFYKKLYGLTGTLGSCEERVELERLYDVHTFEVAPHKPRQFALAPFKIAPSHQHYRALVDELRSLNDQERPLLILMSSIEESEKFSKHLSCLNFPHLLLNEQQLMGEEHVISLAGRPKQITIATNTAGRGTDIRLSPKSLEMGGLHVVFAFYPANDRVENQGFGRAGRQGQLGSGRFVISSDDPAVKEIAEVLGSHYFTLSQESQLQLLQKQRMQRVAALSHQRSVRSAIEHLHHGFLKSFLYQLESWIGQLATFQWEEKSSLPKGCARKGCDAFVEEVKSDNDSTLLIHICKVQKAQSKSQFRSNLAEAQEELKAKILCLWSEHFYGKLDLFSHKQTQDHFDEQSYREQLSAFYEGESQRWIPYLCGDLDQSSC